MSKQLKTMLGRIGARATATMMAVLLAVGSLTSGFAAPAEAVSSAANTSVRQAQTFFSYVEAGERLSITFDEIGSEVRNNSFNPVIVVTDPTGAVRYTCADITVGNPAQSCAQTFTATTGTAGVWSVGITKSDASVSSDVGQVSMSWSIEVAADAGERVGRTWSEDYRTVDNLSSTNPNADLSLWYQTASGFTYRVDRLAMQGADSSFTANAFGNVDKTNCSSAYRSVFANTSSLTGDAARYVWSSTCEFTPFKIFFENPSLDLPAQVTLPDGTTTWLGVDPVAPEVDGVEFRAAGPGSRSGEVKVTVLNFEGNAELRIDVNDDGIFDGADDRAIPFAVDSSGQAMIPFDGLTAAGSEIPVSMPLAFKVEINKIGEIHFVDRDLELLTRGIQITRLNNVAGGSSDTLLYWDDTWVTSTANDPQALVKCSSTPSLTGNGVSSAGGVHGWGVDTCGAFVGGINQTSYTSTTNGGSWGNNRAIDNWTYVGGEWGAVADYPGFTLTKSADPASGAEVEVGSDIAYSVTASPAAYAHPELVTDGLAATTWSGRYSDDVSEVRDNATVRLTDLASKPSSGSSTTVTGDIWTWTGAGIPLTTAVTTTYGATVTSPADGELVNVAYTHTSETPPPAPVGCVPGLCGETTHYVPGFELSKVSVPGSGSTVHVGDVVTYQVVARNTGGTVLDPVTIADDLSDVLDDAELVAGSLAASLGAAPTMKGAALTWAGTLEIGQQVTLSYRVLVKKAVLAGDLLHNVASASATPVVPDPKNPGGPGTPGDPIAPPEVETEHPVPADPGFVVSKVSDPGSGSTVQAGATVTYTVTGSNTGNTVLEPVTITDDLSDVLDDAELVAGSLASSVGAAPTVAGETLTWTGKLGAGESVAITYRVTVKDTVAPGSVLKNLAHGEATPPGGEPITPPGTGTEHPVAVPGFLVSKVSDPASGSRVLAGDTVTYTVTGSNTGNTVLEPVTITDDLSDVLDDAELVAGSLASSVGAAPTVAGETLTWTGKLGAGESVAITYRVTVKDTVAPGSVLKNLAHGEATPPGGEPITPPGTGTEHPLANPGFTLVKDADPATGSQVLAGDTITYTVTGTNTGDTELHPVTITDDLSDVLDDAELVAGSLASSVGNAPTISGETLTWTGTLEVGAKVVLTYRVKVKNSVGAADLVHNTASASATPILPDPDDPEGPGRPGHPITPPDQETRHPVGVPGFAIGKSSDPGSGAAVVAGQVITYTLTASNTGNTALDPVELTDDLAGVLDDAELVTGTVRSSIGKAAVEGKKLSWSGRLGIAEVVTITYQVTVKSGLSADAVLKNVLHGEAVPPGSGTPIVPDEPRTDHPVSVPGFLITKSADPSPGSMVGAGDTITYFVTGANTGETVLDPVVITDRLSDVLDNADLVAGSLKASTGAAPALDGTTLSWRGGLGIGETVIVSYQVTVRGAAGTGALVHNTASGTATPIVPDPDDPAGPGVPGTPITPPEAETTHPIAVPGFTMTKEADPASGTAVKAGDTITYTVTGTNTGNTVLGTVAIADDLSEVLDNATFVDGSVTTSSGATAARHGSTLSWRGSLLPGKAVVITYQVRVNSGQAGELVRNRVHGEAVPVNPDRPDVPGAKIVPPDVETRHPVGGPGAPGGLAFTGANVAAAAAAALGLLIAGGLALLAGRSQRRT